MIKENDLISIVRIDNEDEERFIEVGQGGRVVHVGDEGVRIVWDVVNGTPPENDASDEYFLYFNQIKKES